MATMSIYFPEAEQAKEVRAGLERIAFGLGLTTPQLKGAGAVNALLESLAIGALTVVWTGLDEGPDSEPPEEAEEAPELEGADLPDPEWGTEDPAGLLSDEEVIDLLNQQTPKPWHGDWGQPAPWPREQG